ncbi:MAG: 30S ribosomal protein S20 [Acidobacteria bacterium]|nr:30S ribosomal protein S20 [Acidobacteriota bacterium]BDC47726.1 30S ribosomal protein S20 [Bryobacterales bacterium F-183]
MANTVSSLKRVRTTERRTEVNQMRKTRLRHTIRALRRLMDKKDVKGAEAQIPSTYSLIDRAAKWGIIKKNTASRYKSRVTKRLKVLQAA